MTDMRQWVASVEPIVAESWSRDTSYTPRLWTPENPATGQCAVTALVVNDLVGGTIIRGMVGRTSHYWNDVPGVGRVDLTWSQFPAPTKRPDGGETVGRLRVLMGAGVVERYARLLARVLESYENLQR